MDDRKILITPEQKLDAIMSATLEGVAIIDSRMKVIWANPVAKSWTGRTDEVIGSSCYSVFRNETSICGGCPALKAFKTGNIEKSIEVSSANGEKKSFVVTASPIKDSGGKVLSVAIIAHDLTRSLELESQISEISTRFRAIIDGIGDGISIIDKEFNIVRVNKAILDMFRVSDFSEVLGKKCYRAYYRRDMPCGDCPAEKTFLEGTKNHSTIIRRDGKEKKICDISIFPIKDAEGVGSVIEYVRDITGRINLEDQLLHSERLAGVGELAAGIAHELRNPLSTITSSIQLCLKKYEITDGVKRHLTIILRNSENANRTISELLDFAKPCDMSFKPDNVSRVVEKVCNLVQSRCARQSVRVRKKMQKGMPELILDEKRLESSFMNFMLNSLDAMPEGGTITVSAYYDERKDEIAVSFADTGEGIPAENMGRIFDPFFTTKRKGTGLGLSLAHNFIACHKGRIGVKSGAGKGTEINVRFPVSKNKAGA